MKTQVLLAASLTLAGCAKPRPSEWGIISQLNPNCAGAEWVPLESRPPPDIVRATMDQTAWEYGLASEKQAQSRIGATVTLTRGSEWLGVEFLSNIDRDDPSCPDEAQYRLRGFTDLTAAHLSTTAAELTITLQPVGERRHFLVEAWENEHDFETSNILQASIRSEAAQDLNAESARIQYWFLGNGVGLVLDSEMRYGVSGIAEADSTISFSVDRGVLTSVD